MRRITRCNSRTALRHAVLEALEPRQLLNGLTIITHGYEPISNSRPGWIDTMATAVAARANALETGASIYTLRLEPTNSSTVHVSNFSRLSGPTLTNSNNGEIILLLDYAAVSGIISQSYGATYLASVITPYLLQSFPDIGLAEPMAQGSIQMLGHSRGVSLISEVAKNLGKLGIWVDQFTAFDSVPGPNDASVKLGNNIIFADNYYQTDGDGLFTPNGGKIAGALNVGPLKLGGAYGFIDGTTHSDVHLFYHGTINTASNANDGNHSVKASWYTNSNVTRTTTGFFYSRIGGGLRPAAGVSTLFGGSASRSSVTRAGTQWPNLATVVPSLTTIAPGQEFTVNFRYQDFDSTSQIQWFLDVDQNPYNNNSISLGNATNVAASASIVTANRTFTFTGDTGTYFLEGRIYDGTNHRFAYAPGAILVEVPPKQLVFTQGPANIVAGADFPLTIELRDSEGELLIDDNSTVTLSLGGTAGGTLGGIISVQAVNGVATFADLSIAKAGTYTVTANATDFLPLTSASFNVTPDLDSAQLYLVQQPPDTLIGNTLSPITINVQDQFGNLIKNENSNVTLGVVSGPDGATLTGNTTLAFNNGTATFTNLRLSAAGTYVLSATDVNLPISTPLQFTQNVTFGATTITVSKPSSSYAYGKTITVSAKFKSNISSSMPFTGTATLLDADNNILATADLSLSTSPKINVTGLAPGIYVCTISYPGDETHVAATTAPFNLRVVQAPVKVTLTASSKKLFYGEPVTLTADVFSSSAPSIPPTGILTFKDGSTILGTVDLADGSTFNIPTPTVGSHKYTVEYSGDDNFKPGKSSSLSVSVKKGNTQTTLTTGVGPVTTGQQFTLSVVVTSLVVGSTIPTGTITFKDGSKTLGTAILDNTGAATLTISLATIATHKLTARFSGDTLTSPSTSATLLQVVTAPII